MTTCDQLFQAVHKLYKDRMAQLSTRRANVWLLFLKHFLGVKGRLSLTVTREICSYMAYFPASIVEVTSGFLRFFHHSTWGPRIPLNALIISDDSSSWTVLEDGRVFCSGGNSIKAAYLLGRDGAVESLPPMLSARSLHGVIQVIDVYVFGGCTF